MTFFCVCYNIVTNLWQHSPSIARVICNLSLVYYTYGSYRTQRQRHVIWQAPGVVWRYRKSCAATLITDRTLAANNSIVVSCHCQERRSASLAAKSDAVDIGLYYGWHRVLIPAIWTVVWCIFAFTTWSISVYVSTILYIDAITENGSTRPEIVYYLIRVRSRTR